jgi:hypothetical protein
MTFWHWDACYGWYRLRGFSLDEYLYWIGFTDHQVAPSERRVLTLIGFYGS